MALKQVKDACMSTTRGPSSFVEKIVYMDLAPLWTHLGWTPFVGQTKPRSAPNGAKWAAKGQNLGPRVPPAGLLAKQPAAPRYPPRLQGNKPATNIAECMARSVQ